MIFKSLFQRKKKVDWENNCIQLAKIIDEMRAQKMELLVSKKALIDNIKELQADKQVLIEQLTTNQMPLSGTVTLPDLSDDQFIIPNRQGQ